MYLHWALSQRRLQIWVPSLLSGPDLTHWLSLVNSCRLLQTRLLAWRWRRNTNFGSNVSCEGFPAGSQKSSRRFLKVPAGPPLVPCMFLQVPSRSVAGPRRFPVGPPKVLCRSHTGLRRSPAGLPRKSPSVPPQVHGRFPSGAPQVPRTSPAGRPQVPRRYPQTGHKGID